MGNFFEELRRRNVVRVAGVYAVVGWVLIQIATTLEESMGLPAWFDGLIVALLLIGLPIARNRWYSALISLRAPSKPYRGLLKLNRAKRGGLPSIGAAQTTPMNRAAAIPRIHKQTCRGVQKSVRKLSRKLN